MKERCCRSSPRCASCPARFVALAAARREHSETAALVTEILGGRPAPELPACIEAALQQLQPERATAVGAVGGSSAYALLP